MTDESTGSVSVTDQVKGVIDTIRPLLQADGGDIDLIDIEGNKVLVAFRGMCAQCKMSEFTMKDVVEARLKEFVSDDLCVEEVKD